MEKRAFDLLNCITVVPGALGAWRKKAIEAAGGITADTVAEDADLTIAIRRLGWRISYDEEAIAWTEAPDTASQLIRQRFRWTFGTLQAFWKHGDTLLRPKHGTLGWIALPNIFIFQLVLPLISPVIDLMFFGSLLLWGLAQIRITRLPQLWTTADVEKSLFFFVGFVLIDILTCMVAFALERKEDWTLLFPVRQGSCQRPPRRLARRRAGFSPASAQSSPRARPRRRQLSLLTPRKPGRLIPWGRGHVLKRHTPCFLEDLRRDRRESASPFLSFR